MIPSSRPISPSAPVELIELLSGRVLLPLVDSLAPEMNRTKIPGDDGLARQCSPAGNSLNNEERGNDLFVATVR